MKKTFITSLALLTLSACSHVQPIPDNWKNDNLNNICMYWGKAKAAGDEVMALRIEDEVAKQLPNFTERQQRECLAYAKQGYNIRKQAYQADAERDKAVQEYNRNMAIMNQNINVNHSGSIDVY